MDVSSRRITSLGPQVSPSGEMNGERATNRETQPLTRRAAQASANSKVFTKHESRDTRHETRLFSDTRFETGPLGTEALQSFFSASVGIASGEKPFLRSRDARIRGANASNESKVRRPAGIPW